MNRFSPRILLVAFSFACLAQSVFAAGISIDAGLTPPEDRWILRNQFRYMEKEDDPTAMDREMYTYAFPTVIAYGFTPDLTLIARQAIKQRTMEMGETSRDAGFGDLLLLAKYKLYRLNTRDYIFGLAGTLGLELPTGDDDFGSETWDLQPGFFASWRSGPWQSDFNATYKWNGFADEGRNGLDPGDKISLDLAFAHQFNLTEEADTTIAPVLELNYEHNTRDSLSGRTVDNTGESLFFVSPGIKFTKSSFIFEALVQFPVWQDQEGSQLEQGTRFIVGTRFLF
ncbi:hypothetical protein STSP2_01611 [Anaerohalosphaera lusitana]|uniref:Protein involved in meta-pathway of phenol degradation n=1 Tax=Anaerohalosphaera lusitana TaxID=1936003 RepID=A0A1U9NKW8_9BACT|nr:transporter [Anaerohalosphaera lusitana]AQT68447.1 hypothetical protein STSP2_01611 [Anaerohalosphaera lusitana]